MQSITVHSTAGVVILILSLGGCGDTDDGPGGGTERTTAKWSPPWTWPWDNGGGNNPPTNPPNMDGDCVGTAVACTSRTLGTCGHDIRDITGCWKRRNRKTVFSCTGDATPCANLSKENCGKQRGCSWESNEEPPGGRDLAWEGPKVLWYAIGFAFGSTSHNATPVNMDGYFNDDLTQRAYVTRLGPNRMTSQPQYAVTGLNEASAYQTAELVKSSISTVRRDINCPEFTDQSTGDLTSGNPLYIRHSWAGSWWRMQFRCVVVRSKKHKQGWIKTSKRVSNLKSALKSHYNNLTCDPPNYRPTAVHFAVCGG